VGPARMVASTPPMEIAVAVLRVVNLVAAAFLAGGQMFCKIAVLPALPGFPPAMSARVHADALTDRPHLFLRAWGIVEVLTGVALVALLAVHGVTPALVLTAVGLALTVVSGLVSTKEWPINEEIKSWGLEPKLDRYAELRRLWDLRHVRRTWLSLAALVSFAAAMAVAGTV
jgi:hypothetical protein